MYCVLKLDSDFVFARRSSIRSTLKFQTISYLGASFSCKNLFYFRDIHLIINLWAGVDGKKARDPVKNGERDLITVLRATIVLNNKLFTLISSP